MVLILFVLGICLGSFVSAVSWRVPRRISFVKGRSICPNCKHVITWYDNIPLLSYLILKGKCRYCGKKISLRYPAIELASAIGFIIIFLLTFKGPYVQGQTLYVVYSIFTLIRNLTVFVILLTIFIIDLENQIIPDSLTFFGIACVLLYSIVFNPQSIILLIFSGLAASVFLLFIYLITKGKGMGLGDVKFAVLGGMIVGLKLLPIWLLLSFLTGAISGCILILIGRAKMKTKIAFGPFLVIGVALSVLFGEKIISFLHF